MSYGTIDESTAEGRPLFLYQFVEGAEAWRFTSRATEWVSPAGAIADETEDLTWAPAVIAHGTITQSPDPQRVPLELSFPLSHAFARRFLGPRGPELTTLTIYRGHEQLPAETVAQWKGRVVEGVVAGQRIELRCESLFTTLRRAGVRAKYQRLCRHALYGRGCTLDIEAFFVSGTASSSAGAVVEVPEASLQPDGWYRGGVLRHDGAMAFILGHSGATLVLARGLPALIEAVAAQGSAAVQIAPGCDLRAATCRDKFANLDNFGGFPEIPGRNPFGGGSIL